ncbi:MAG: Hsp20/alpha crystallin family protein [Myxococcota bacterium]|nr:Hsp20/alpha crystallin family protein [Myxococcota bacterium]
MRLFDPFDLESGRGSVLDRLFDREREGGGTERFAPAVDVAENDDQYVVTAEVPGASKDDVTVEMHDNVLTIRGEKRSEREGKKEHSRWVERTYGSFSRSFTLPANADEHNVHASFRDGVLTVEIPKREEAKPRTIAVQ